MANTIKIKRGSGSDPAASDMVLGEPVLRTDTAELFFKKDDGSVAKVSGGGGGPDFKYLELRNAANNGAASYPANDFTLVTSGTTTAITPAAANTLLVSVNGVIQKPNAGTSTSGITGFIVDGSRLKTATNLTQAPDFILYQESGGIGEPSDNTVSEAKLNVSNSPINGYFLSAQSGNTGGLTWAAPIATSCTGNSATATALATARTINGTSFDGTANITVTAAAGTLTGTTLNSSVVTSSLTSLGDLAGLTVDGDMSLTGANYNVLWDKSDNALEFADNAKAIFGTGSDLQIYFDGTNSFIKEPNSVAGQLVIDGYNGTDIRRGATGDHMIRAIGGGSVELYHNGSLKANTRSDGFEIKQHLTMGDSDEIRLGNSSDLKIFHDGSDSLISNSTGVFFIQNAGDLRLRVNNTEAAVHCVANGAVELHYDNSKKFETTSTGVQVDGGLTVSSDYPTINLTDTNDNDFRIQNRNGVLSFVDVANSDVVRFAIDSGNAKNSMAGTLAVGTLELDDNAKAKFGTGDDLQIYHDGSHSFIDSTLAGGQVLIRTKESGGTTNNAAKFMPTGAVELYYDGSKKLNTEADGITVTGNIGIGDDAPNYQLHATTSIGIGAHGFNQQVTINSTGIQSLLLGTGYRTLNLNELGGDVDIANDSSKLRLGASQDLQIFHDGSDSFIKDTGTGALKICSSLFRVNNAANNEAMIKAEQDAGVTLSFNGNESCETTTDGLKVKDGTGSVAALEVVSTGTNRSDMRILATGSGDAHLWLDASNGDLQGGDYATIYHSNTSGNLNLVNYANDMEFYVRGGSVGAGGLRKAAHFTNNGNVELYHNGQKKFETTSKGIKVEGGQANGELGVFHATGSTFQSCTLQSVASRNTTNRTYLHFKCSINGIADKMEVRDSGDVRNTNNSYGSISDISLKENIVDAGSQWDDIKNIRVRKFNFKEATDPLQKTMLGVVAQEAELVCPNLVDTEVSLQEGEEKEYKSFKYSVLYMKAIKCLQEAMAKIEVLEAKVTTLEAK